MVETHSPTDDELVARAFRMLSDDVASSAVAPGPAAAVRGARRRSARAAVGTLIAVAVAIAGASAVADLGDDQASQPDPAGRVTTPSVAPSDEASPTVDLVAPTGPVTASSLLPAAKWPPLAGWLPWQESEIGLGPVAAKGSCLPADRPEGLTGEELMRTVGGPFQDGQIGQVAVRRFSSSTAAGEAVAAAQAAGRCEPEPFRIRTDVVPGASTSFIGVRLSEIEDAPPEGEGMGYAQIGTSIVEVRVARTNGPAPTEAEITQILRRAVQQALTPASE